jgi:lipoprotein-releasing system ATP-binding protein
MTNDIILSARDVKRDYLQAGTDKKLSVICNLSLDIVRGQTLAIVGVSGSGKTTLLNLLGGIDDACAGSVSVAGKDWKELSASERAAWRNQHVGFVYQFHHLLGEFSALENVAMPCLIGGQSVAASTEQAAQLLARVGLADRMQHRPAELSGGERQRVAIARALAQSPSLVLMDEPTGNLDPKTAASVMELLISLNQDLNISFVVVTHDQLIAKQLDRIVSLEAGCLKEGA